MLKQMLCAISVLAVTGAAYAEDITNPFYLAMKGQVGSITSFQGEKLVVKNKYANTKSIRMMAQEELQYGLTDSLSIFGTFGNTWDKWKGTPQNFLDPPAQKAVKDNENIAWSAGLGWNVFSGPFNWQLSAQYGQDRLKNFSGEYKYIKGETKLGYRFKKVLPYVTGAVEIPVGQKSGIKGIAGDKFIYDTKVGIYQGACEVWSLDTGVRLSYNENTEARVFTAEAEASYYLTPKTTLGVYGTYALDGHAKYDRDIYDKTAGVRLRLFF